MEENEEEEIPEAMEVDDELEAILEEHRVVKESITTTRDDDSVWATYALHQKESMEFDA